MDQDSWVIRLHLGGEQNLPLRKPNISEISKSNAKVFVFTFAVKLYKCIGCLTTI